MRSEGVSILMSTHYIEEAERLCDEVTIMSHGKAVAVGPPSELIAEHAGSEAIEVYGPPVRLTEVERFAQECGWRTRRTGTSISILHANGDARLDGGRLPRDVLPLRQVRVPAHLRRDPGRPGRHRGAGHGRGALDRRQNRRVRDCPDARRNDLRTRAELGDAPGSADRGAGRLRLGCLRDLHRRELGGDR